MDILRGNADLAESCAWSPPGAFEMAPLPSCEHESVLAKIALVFS